MNLPHVICASRAVTVISKTCEDGREVILRCIGHDVHGKTILTNALAMVSASTRKRSPHYDQTDIAPKKSANGNTSSFVGLIYETNIRCYVQVDFYRHASYTKTMTTGDVQIDDVVLVVSCAEGPMTQTREQILLYPSHGLGPLSTVFEPLLDPLSHR
ncbi:hypothetical protein V6N13_066695 [Hibiscus sabdariffa]|uniref:Tr-type G domain-containing protein n=1 Tax=Hibiscus sabdariffa TaxID=183260 RepID=A0ABR2DR91_9ROSI